MLLQMDKTYNYVWGAEVIPVNRSRDWWSNWHFRWWGFWWWGFCIYFATSSATASTTMVVVDTNLKIAGPSVTGY